MSDFFAELERNIPASMPKISIEENLKYITEIDLQKCLTDAVKHGCASVFWFFTTKENLQKYREEIEKCFQKNFDVINDDRVFDDKIRMLFINDSQILVSVSVLLSEKLVIEEHIDPQTKEIVRTFNVYYPQVDYNKVTLF